MIHHMHVISRSQRQTPTANTVQNEAKISATTDDHKLSYTSGGFVIRRAGYIFWQV